jgi:hypothetical protein
MKSQNLEIDVAGICSVRHKCTGCIGESKKCCSSYEVTISSREMKNIIGCLPLATQFCSHLKSHHDYVNVFEKIATDLYAIDTNEEGTCVFAYFEGDRIACSLHVAAEKYGIPFRKVKPESCLLWPLAVFEGKSKILSVHDDIFEFNCNARNAEGVFSLCPSIADNIENVFGIEFMKDLQEAADKGLRWTKIALRGPFASKPCRAK